MFKEQFPRVELDLWPTPIHKLKRYGDLIGLNNLYMKRDDISLVGLGGNKLRKLEFWLGDAIQKSCDTILVAGGAQSNLVRLTAAACAKIGLKCIAIHNSAKPENLQGNTLLNKLFAAESLYYGNISEEERSSKTQELFKDLVSQGFKPYIINDEFIGTLGYTECAEEIYYQNKNQNLNIKNIVIVGAMAFTSSGFIYGNNLLPKPFTTHVISVEYKKEKLDQLIQNKISQLKQLTGVKPLYDYQKNTYTYEEYMGEGWSIPTKPAMQQIYNLAKTEAIVVDHVYNAKTLAGLAGLVKRGILKKHEPTCIIHTGGSPSVFGYADLIAEFSNN